MDLIKNNLIYKIKKEASDKKFFQKGLSKKLEKKLKALIEFEGEELLMATAIINMSFDNNRLVANNIKEYYKIQNRSWIKKLNLIKALINKNFLIYSYEYMEYDNPFYFNIRIDSIIYNRIFYGMKRYKFNKDNKKFYGNIISLFILIKNNLTSLPVLEKEILNINSSLPNNHFIKKLSKKMDDSEIFLLYLTIYFYLLNNKNFELRSLGNFTKDYFYDSELYLKLRNNEFYIQKINLIRYMPGNYKNVEMIEINSSLIKKLESGKEFDISYNTGILQERKKTNTVDMIYDKELEKEIKRITNALQEGNYERIKKRMKEDKLPESMTFLFYGPSGTGKSETVYNIAKATKRRVVEVKMGKVNGGGLVGDFERETKNIFSEYKTLCEISELTPILLINEADSLLSKRISVNIHNDKTENFRTNLILDELDKFEGILFATTNLKDDFDNAMDRRFLQKIKFNIPNERIRGLIWKQKLPLFDMEEYEQLSKYIVTGGIIDNIVRRCKIQSNLEMREPEISEVVNMLETEAGFREKSKRNVGFMPNVQAV